MNVSLILLILRLCSIISETTKTKEMLDVFFQTLHLNSLLSSSLAVFVLVFFIFPVAVIVLAAL